MKRSLLIGCFVVIGLAISLGCDRLEILEFAPKTARLDHDRSADLFAWDGKCSDNKADGGVDGGGLMAYPMFERRGVTTITGDRDGRAFAKDPDGRFYYNQGEEWVQVYQACYWDAWGDGFCPSKHARYGSLWHEGGDTVLGFWVPPRSDDLITVGLSKVQSYVDDPSIYDDLVGWEDWVFEAIGFYYTGPNILETDRPYGAGYGWSAPYEEDITESLKIVWWNAVWGSSYKSFILVGGKGYRNGLSSAPKSDSFAWQMQHADTLSGLISICRDELMEPIPIYVPSCQSADAAPNVPLTDVWGTSVANFWVVGNLIEESCPKVTGKIYHCNEKKCLEEASYEGVFLKSIWGINAGNIFAVGGNDEHNALSVILKRVSSKWTEHIVDTNVPLNKIWGTSSNNIFAVGGAYSKDGTPSSVALRYDGSQWRQIPLNSKKPLYSIWGRSEDDVYFVGEEGFFHYPDEQENPLPAFEATNLCRNLCDFYDQCIASENTDDVSDVSYDSEEEASAAAAELLRIRNTCRDQCPSYFIGSMKSSTKCEATLNDLMRCVLNNIPCDEAGAVINDLGGDQSICKEAYDALDCKGLDLVAYFSSFYS
ncbi:MAG: hypothetical protein GY847_33600 [Proteobacteria bacterium]|nr:hypothetical protein [Pseudomonadota bacterium]